MIAPKGINNLAGAAVPAPKIQKINRYRDFQVERVASAGNVKSLGIYLILATIT